MDQIDLSVRFNNAGVACLRAGHRRVAWDFFKASLELKLAAERTIDQPCQNSYVLTAEGHLERLEEYTSNPLEARSSTGRGEVSSVLPGNVYNPFLFFRPFVLPEDSSMTSKYQSASVIFNLALVHHLQDPSSQQALALYDLSTSLLAGDNINGLGVALLNNLGVWCFENDDFDGARVCMEHLSKFSEDCTVLVEEDESLGLQSNIKWLLSPPCPDISPAA